MTSIKPSLSSLMFYFRSPQPSPKNQQLQQHAHDDIEIATPPGRRGVARTTSSRDDTALHQRRQNHLLPPLDHQDHSNGSDHNEPLVSTSNLNATNSNHLHLHHPAPPPVSGTLFLQQHGKNAQGLSASAANKGSLLVSSQSQQAQQKEMALIHPMLHKIPLQFRFGLVGLFSNILFMVVYNLAVYYFERQFTPSTLYSFVYLIYIPLGHLLLSLLVFGWPEKYLQSLMSNFPIGLTAMAIGSALTAYCDYKDFNNRVEEYIRDYFTFSHMPSRPDEAPSSEFYTSILVMGVTSLWTYVLSVYINSPQAKSDKKEL